MAALMLAAALLPVRAAERAGAWWSGLQQAERVAYATGFLDGNTYAAFAVSGAIRRTGARGALAEEIMRMNIDAIYGEIDAVSADQLADAASRIYADSRNSEIAILEVLYAAARSARGASEAETSRFLETRRRRGTSK